MSVNDSITSLLSQGENVPSTHRVGIKVNHHTRLGQRAYPRRAMHALITEITRRALSIMWTNHARKALETLAQIWIQRHDRQRLSPTRAVEDFRRLLRRAQMNGGNWLTVVVDWTMLQGTIAEYYEISKQHETDPHARYPVEHEWICLSGVRVHCLAEDIAQNKPEQHVRKMELIWAYCHEIAHIFISYLSFVTDNRSARPQSPTSRQNSPTTSEDGGLGSPTVGESGRTLERLLFGGIYLRGEDNSGRDQRFAVGTPLLVNPMMQTLRIPLSFVVNISTKDIRCPYTDTDLVTDGVCTIITHPAEANITMTLLRFEEEFRMKYGRRFCPPGQYQDTLNPPASVYSQMSGTIFSRGQYLRRYSQTTMIWDGRKLRPSLPGLLESSGSPQNSARSNGAPGRASGGPRSLSKCPLQSTTGHSRVPRPFR